MSDNESKKPSGGSDVGSAVQTSVEDPNLLNAADQEFLVQCLTHSVGGLQVDLTAVAEARGQKSAMAVKNRLLSLKKRLNLPLIGRNQSGKGINDAATDGAAVPKTPKKAAANRVTKPRTPASGKKAPTKRTPKKQAKSEIIVKEDSDVEKMDQGEMDQGEKMDQGEEPDYDLQPAEIKNKEAESTSGSATTTI